MALPRGDGDDPVMMWEKWHQIFWGLSKLQPVRLVPVGSNMGGQCFDRFDPFLMSASENCYRHNRPWSSKKACQKSSGLVSDILESGNGLIELRRLGRHTWRCQGSLPQTRELMEGTKENNFLPVMFDCLRPPWLSSLSVLPVIEFSLKCIETWNKSALLRVWLWGKGQKYIKPFALPFISSRF